MKKTMKQAWALALAAAMLCMSVLGGCGKGGTGDNGNADTGGAAVSGGTEGTGQEAQGEPYEVVMTYVYWGTLSPDFQMIEDAVNEITVDEINVKVSFLPLSMTEIGTQPGLMISSNEKLDLVIYWGQSYFLEAINKKMLIPLDDLYAQYGQAIEEDLDVAIKGGYMGGTLYGIPSTRVRANSNGIFIMTEYVEKYGLDVSQEISYEELDAFFEKVKAGEGADFYPLIMSGSNTTTFEFFQNMDVLGADVGCGAILDYDNSSEVINVFESEEYAEHVRWMHKWYEAGYINGDAVTSSEMTQVMVQNGMGCSYLLSTYWDMEGNQEAGLGFDLTPVDLTGYRCTTDVYQGQSWGIPTTCENPEATFRFLNLLYDNEEVINLIYWGIEGTHYEMTEDPGILRYPEGIDAQSVTYSQPLGLYGAVDKMYQIVPQPADYFDRMAAFNASISETADVSPCLGYAFDNSEVKSEYAAVTDVLTQYRASLETGSVDPEVVLPEFISALKAAGIDTIIEANQASLDAWIAEQQ